MKNAISLIVLVITIIVMAILAATIIITLSNTNIISQANDAVKKTEAQQVEEMKALMLADGMLGKNPGSQTIGDTTLEWDNVNKEVIEKRNGQLVKEGAVIPTDFYYVGGTKDTGVVISDDATDENKGVDYTCTGNQFVWVPVDDFSKFVRGEPVETSKGSGIYKMTNVDGLTSNTEYSLNYTEPYEEAADWEKAEYNAMMQSVQKYSGFYIARFESGDGDVTTARTTKTEAHKVVSKKGAFVYNYISWGDSMTEIGTTGAVYLSQNMYKNSTSVASTLCYGVQWDATLNFVSDINHNICSSSWGNHTSTAFVMEGEGEAATLQKTGSNEEWKAKNIYDLTGNVWELTMEYGDFIGYSPLGRIYRGGGYDVNNVYDKPASARWDFPGEKGAPFSSGFRVTLYLK